MSWDKVGKWLKENAGTGTQLVGSIMTGNVPAAIALGASLVSSATGTDNPDDALLALQGNPDALTKLKELYFANEANIRLHNETIMRLEYEDKQHEHATTQKTIINADNSEYKLVRFVRPTHATVSLIAAIVYVFTNDAPDLSIMGAFLVLPLSYAGLRGIDKTMAIIKTGKAGV